MTETNYLDPGPTLETFSEHNPKIWIMFWKGPINKNTHKHNQK